MNIIWWLIFINLPLCHNQCAKNMPTIFNINGLRYFFYSGDHQPIHVHVMAGTAEAKFELEPCIKMVYNHGLTPAQIRMALRVIADNKDIIMRAWQQS